MNEEKISSDKNIVYSLRDISNHNDICKLGKALSSDDRVRILRALLSQPKYMIELSNELVIPLSTVSRHIDVLAEAKLIYISYEPGPKGHSKLCSKALISAKLLFEDLEISNNKSSIYTTEMPIGMFSDCNITAPCGMNGKTSTIASFDDPAVFYSPERAKAELIWFNTGFLSYMLPLKNKNTPPEELTLSFEICSETIYHRNKWPSDITVILNDREIVTFTSQGDFGGRRGKYTPEYWPIISTQYGILMNFMVNSNGVYVNKVLKNDKIKIDDLNINEKPYIKLTLAIKDDAIHKGGLNLFGKNFGDHNQAIILTIT